MANRLLAGSDPEPGYVSHIVQVWNMARPPNIPFFMTKEHRRAVRLPPLRVPWLADYVGSMMSEGAVLT